MYRSLVYDYGANLFTGAAQVTDTLAAALESQPNCRRSWPGPIKKRRRCCAQGDAERGLYRVAVDPNDPDQFNKLLALNELAPAPACAWICAACAPWPCSDAAGGATMSFRRP